jgi:hypothetical protein
MGPRAGLGTVQKGNSCRCRESYPGRPVRDLLILLTQLTQLRIITMLQLHTPNYASIYSSFNPKPICLSVCLCACLPIYVSTSVFLYMHLPKYPPTCLITPRVIISKVEALYSSGQFLAVLQGCTRSRPRGWETEHLCR